MHDDLVPALLADHAALVGEVPVDARAGVGFQVNLVAQACLLCERFEQCRHAPFALLVEVGDGVGAVELDRRSCAISEAVADEENAAGESLACAHQQAKHQAADD
jgi:hypothetical protein